MAYYIRIIWGLKEGEWDVPVVGAPHFLGLHLEPGLLVVAGLARMHIPIAPMLLALQAIAAGAAIFPAARLARRRLSPLVGDSWAFLAALSIYLVPTVTRCLDYDFHPTTVAILPLMGFIDAVDEGEWRKGWIWFAIALSLREDIGLQGAAVALTLLVFPQRPGDRLQALFLTIVGLGWFFGYVLYVQPRFLPPVGSYDLHFARFAGEGAGAAGVLRAAAHDPAALGRHLASEGRPLYLLWLLLPVACLPLVAPRWLAGALPLVAINLLSDVPGV